MRRFKELVKRPFKDNSQNTAHYDVTRNGGSSWVNYPTLNGKTDRYIKEATTGLQQIIETSNAPDLHKEYAHAALMHLQSVRGEVSHKNPNADSLRGAQGALTRLRTAQRVPSENISQQQQEWRKGAQRTVDALLVQARLLSPDQKSSSSLDLPRSPISPSYNLQEVFELDGGTISHQEQQGASSYPLEASYHPGPLTPGQSQHEVYYGEEYEQSGSHSGSWDNRDTPTSPSGPQAQSEFAPMPDPNDYVFYPHTGAPYPEHSLIPDPGDRH